MVFGLIGLVFNLVTFPGILVNQFVQELYAGKYGAPSSRIAIDERVDLDELAEMNDRERSSVARVLGPGESPNEGEREEFVTNYDGIESYRGLFGVVLAPFLACSALAFLILLAWIPFFDLSGIGLLGVWLGFSIAAHSFPNGQATDALWNRTTAEGGLLLLVGAPVVGFAHLVNLLEFLWLDAIYAVAIFAAVSEVIVPALF